MPPQIFGIVGVTGTPLIGEFRFVGHPHFMEQAFDPAL
jgi:hypothetical protein